MRILFTFAGGSGHLEPLVPIARLAKAVGHAVSFACRPWMVPKVESNGFTGFAVGNDKGLTPIRRPLVAVDVEKEIQMIGKGYALRIPREIAADVLPLCETWHPDVIVCEEMDFGTMIVAERLAIPYVTVLVIASGALIRREVVVGPLDEVRTEYGLPPDPDLAMLSRHLVLAPFPLSFRASAFPLPATAHTIRPLVPEAPPDAETPAWLVDLPDAPTVYFTLGTVSRGGLVGNAMRSFRVKNEPAPCLRLERLWLGKSRIS